MNEMETNTETESPEEPEGIDAIIAQVQSYKENPKLVTPETLADLEEKLLDLKGFLDGEDSDETETEEPKSDDNGLMIMIGKAKHGGMK